MKRYRWTLCILCLFIWAAGCATAIPVRDAVKVDMSAPVGMIDGNQFTGIRYPFKVTAPPGWNIATAYPKFMMDLGYEKEGLEESEVFLYNPATQSNLQIDLTPAGRYSTFDQEYIQGLTAAAGDGLIAELRQEHGKDLQVTLSPTVPVSLKGVSYAAERHGTYSVKGVKRQQGWIYAFTEPYQIFILYMVVDKNGDKDRQAIKEILSSFEIMKK